MSRRRFEVEEGEAGRRLDKLVAARFPTASRAELSRLFRRGAVRLDGAIGKKGTLARAGATVELDEIPPGPDELRPLAQPEIELEVLYEDSAMTAIAKPAGMPSHPLRAGERGTAANALVGREPSIARVGRDPREAGLIHRLDRGTSGVLVAARTQPAWESLRRALSEGRAEKSYLALARGRLDDRGRVAAPLAQRGGRAVVDPRGLPAETAWEVLARSGDLALVSCTARTGRMHQVRAHLAHAGAPIVGDATYGGEPAEGAGLFGHFLHASSISLPHPVTGARLEIRAPLPPDRRAALAWLGFQPDEVER